MVDITGPGERGMGDSMMIVEGILGVEWLYWDVRWVIEWRMNNIMIRILKREYQYMKLHITKNDSVHHEV
jgi:hypothetical protein